MLGLNNSNMSKRNYTISKKDGELFNVELTDSYGEVYQNYFHTIEEASAWICQIWEDEEILQQDSMKLLEDAIYGCTKLDEELGLLKGNRDNLD